MVKYKTIKKYNNLDTVLKPYAPFFATLERRARSFF